MRILNHFATTGHETGPIEGLAGGSPVPRAYSYTLDVSQISTLAFTPGGIVR